MSNILSNNVVLISLLLVWCFNVLDLYVLIRSGAIQKCSLDKLENCSQCYKLNNLYKTLRSSILTVLGEKMENWDTDETHFCRNYCGSTYLEYCFINSFQRIQRVQAWK